MGKDCGTCGWPKHPRTTHDWPICQCKPKEVESELTALRAENEELRSIAASAIGAMQIWESWSERLATYVKYPNPKRHSIEVGKRFTTLVSATDREEERTDVARLLPEEEG